MKQMLFSVRDTVASQYLPPFPAPVRGVAIRLFGDAIKDANGPISKHPGDYELVFLGFFDDESGAFEEAPTEVLSRGQDFVEGAQLRAVS